jgi:aldehyde dehydrogenase (NAD+)
MIHFTGSPKVGRVVMAAAARHLTPVVLELGGQAPAYVHDDVDVAATARRVVFGRLYNTGQACIAINHVLVQEAVFEEFLVALGKAIDGFYAGEPRTSPDYGRILNATHHARLVGMLDDRVTIVHGGDHDAAERYFEPTVVVDVPDDHPLLTEEIFGPILPVVPVSGVDEAIRRINGAPGTPLAVYAFAADERIGERIVTETRSGTAGVNTALTIVGNQALPFGGLGESGMGSYTGEDSFRCFSHFKSVAKLAHGPEDPARLPPYGEQARARLQQRFDAS